MNAANAPLIAQLLRVTERESTYLDRTTARLRAEQPDLAWVRSLPEHDQRSELLDAFVSRYSRLQDTVGDKLLPALLKANQERLGSQLDNLLRAEKLGWIASTEAWISLRELRNRLVHEYVETPERLLEALRHALDGVATLRAAQSRLREEAQRHGWVET